MARPTQLTLCSFCGKSHAEVKKLIQGPGVYICDSCIIVCKNVLDKELRTENRKQMPKLNVPKPAEIKRLLDLHCIGQEHAKKTLAVAALNHYKRGPRAEWNKGGNGCDPNAGVRVVGRHNFSFRPPRLRKTPLARPPAGGLGAR